MLAHKKHNMTWACRKLAEARSSIVVPPPTSPHQALQGWPQHSYKNVSDSFEKRDRSFRNVSCDAASVDVMPRVVACPGYLLPFSGPYTEPNDAPGSVVVKALASHECSERPWVQISFLDILHVTPVAGLGVSVFFWVLRFPLHSLFHYSAKSSPVGNGLLPNKIRNSSPKNSPKRWLSKVKKVPYSRPRGAFITECSCCRSLGGRLVTSMQRSLHALQPFSASTYPTDQRCRCMGTAFFLRPVR